MTSLATIGCTVNSTTANPPNSLEQNAESTLNVETSNAQIDPEAVEAAELFLEIQENVRYKAAQELENLRKQTLSPLENQQGCEPIDDQILTYVCTDTINHLGEKAWEMILENSSPLPENTYKAAHRLVDQRMHFRIDQFAGDDVTSSPSLHFEEDVSLRQKIDEWQSENISDCMAESNIYIKIACEDIVTQLGPEAWEALFSSSDLPNTAEGIAIFTEEIDYLWYQEALEADREVGEFVAWFDSEERREAYQEWRSLVNTGLAQAKLE